MVALLKYGAGMPFNRIEATQEKLEVPMPTSTQWDLVADAEPASREPLLRHPEPIAVINEHLNGLCTACPEYK
jgi:hypothetical protein